MNLFRFIPGYETAIYDEGKEPLFFLFLSFQIGFVLTRIYTRTARKRGWGSGTIHGVHLHHSAVGIALVLIAGLLHFTPSTSGTIGSDICAIVFGVGAALVLDEWALVFYLRDVYWTAQGRKSVDACILGVMAAGLCLVATEPFSTDTPTRHLGRLVFFAIIAAHLAFVAITFLKGKPFFGAAAIPLPVFGWLGALRLAKPSSPWARWFYQPDRGPERDSARRAAKLERAKQRSTSGFATRFHRRLDDFLGGAPTSP